ncbi:MAG TPA: cytochrome c [Candidatus Acidoferrales bacterium]|nr:cytochrome c [Candidatus Acidoferrales bacterium]
MKTAIRTIVGTVALFVLGYSAVPRETPAPQQSGTSVAADDARKNAELLAMGRELFVKRCASCHNERGDKPLSNGLPLAERSLTREQIVRNVGGRLRSATDEQRRGVVLYIESFLKNKHL